MTTETISSGELLEAQRVLSEQLARQDYGPPLIGDAILRTCLGAVEYAIAEQTIDAPIPRTNAR